MIKVTIGNNEKEFSKSNIDTHWINQQINNRREDGQTVCARVTIDVDPVNMTLSSAGCPRGSGGFQPNNDQMEIIKLWEKRGLNEENFHGGNLVAFLKQLQI